MNAISGCRTLLVAAVLFGVWPALSQAQLPEGDGKAIVTRACSVCHDLHQVARGQYSRRGWEGRINRMIEHGAVVKKEEIPIAADYLAKHFPEVPAPKAVVVPGDIEISIMEWKVPEKANPHDPLIMADGSIFYASTGSNELGQLDPTSGLWKKFPAKSPDGGPHGLINDAQGHVWFTAAQGDYIGHLDPKTGEITEHKLKDPSKPDTYHYHPHTPVFDDKGILFFTMFDGNMMGRMNPKTGEIKLVSVPTTFSGPYGLRLDSKGTPWFVEFNRPKVASMDPVTMAIKEYTLPNPLARPRRLAITADDKVYYTDFYRGYLGMLDPKTGATKEWPSPSGKKSEPYGILAIGDIVWYSESGTEKNTLVRFDPKTEKFQSWEIPSGGGVVRHMMADKDGVMWLATSGVQGLARVEVRDKRLSSSLR
jgi:virginiamycin B lyase